MPERIPLSDLSSASDQEKVIAYLSRALQEATRAIVADFGKRIELAG